MPTFIEVFHFKKSLIFYCQNSEFEYDYYSIFFTHENPKRAVIWQQCGKFVFACAFKSSDTKLYFVLLGPHCKSSLGIFLGFVFGKSFEHLCNRQSSLYFYYFLYMLNLLGALNLAKVTLKKLDSIYQIQLISTITHIF